MHMAARCKNEEESASLPASMVEGDRVLDLCLEWDSYDSGYCKANEVLPVLINGGLGWLCHKLTNTINDPSSDFVPYEHVQCNGE